MAIVSISEASRLTGKSTKTLYRMASQGRLSLSVSEKGTKEVDTSELARVFGNLITRDETSFEAHSESHVRQLEKEIAQLREVVAQVEVLKAEKAGLEAIAALREEQIQDMRQAMRLLEHQRETPENGRKRRWWRF